MGKGFPTSICLIILVIGGVSGNSPPVVTQDIDNTVLSEGTPVGTVVGTLMATDPELFPVKFGILGTDRFQVDASTGEVTLVKPLDREVNSTLQFYITVEDDFNNLVSIVNSVIVDDVNDNPPIFKNTPYEALVNEDTEVGSVIFKDIVVEDVDETGEILEVFCKDYEKFPNVCENFEIVALNSSGQEFYGSVVLKGKLNYADKQFYQLLLLASDGTRNASTGLEVKVGDVQDSPPVFQGSLTGVIEEDDPIGTLVMTVRAKDGDRGAPRLVIYDLLTNPLDYFLLDSQTGELRTAKPLDRESLQNEGFISGILNLTIRAREVVDDVPVDSPVTSTVTSASVTIKDVNDEPPRFNQNEYQVKLVENLPMGTPLPNLDMTVTDSDIGVNSKFSLRLEDVSGAFAVEPTSGSGFTAVSIRIVNRSLDYENPNNRKFIVLVVAKETETKERLSSTATVKIEITDANDNLPVFDQEAYSTTVDETALPGDTIITITAADIDTGSFGTKGIVYQLVGFGAEKFNVNKKSGVISVAPCSQPGAPECLDFETKPVYYLTYQATDEEGNGHSSVVSLKISLNDNNDNPPVFESTNYTVLIDEGSSKFELPLQVHARDPDKTADLVYSIIGGNENSLFSIDSASGEIYVTNKKGLDMTGLDTNVINLTVQASDGNFTASTNVEITVVDVNNNHPVFKQEEYSVSVPENTPPGSVLVQVLAEDADVGVNSEVVYRIEKGAFGDFSIDRKSGNIVVSSKLDFDRRNSYSIDIIAVDGGTPALTGTTTLSIEVANTNDKFPFFSPSTQRAEIKEDAKVGDVVHTLIAKDLDISSDEALNFAASEPITAVDNNGKEVIDDNSFKDFFSVDRNTGIVTVAKPLHREVAAAVRITVLVTDITAPTTQQGTGMLIITIVDVNDYAPVFLKPWTVADPTYSEQILEEQPADTPLGTFTATDQDSNSITYSIEPENEYFHINNITGEVRTKKRLDYEQTQVLAFKIVANDSGLPQLSATALVTVNVININDMDPVFDQEEYTFSVKEDAKAGTLIGQVTAADGDVGYAGKISYSFSEPNPQFSIDQDSGEIFVTSSSSLDRETTKEFILKAVASDNAPGDESRSKIVPVHIKISDVNDNKPQFLQKEYVVNIVESIPLSPPAPILQLRAQDRDISSDLTYSILSGNEDEVFTLDTIKGIMYPRISLQNQKPTYSLKVGVSDGLFSDEATVNIHVQAINQNQPVFVEPSSLNATIVVDEDDNEIGRHVMTVKARDGDSGENGRVTYHFKVNNENVQETSDFVIDEVTGEMRSKGVLDRDTKSTYQLVLVARDHGTIPHEGIQFLTVAIRDKDDNDPMFASTDPYVFLITENSAPHSRVGKVEAVDIDEGDNARIFYYLINDPSKRFIVDRTTGEISTNVSLDREEKDSYSLYIKATNDPGFYAAKGLEPGDLKPSKSVALVNILVLDENDNSPRFLQKEYYAGVNVNARTGEFVASVKATDDDAELNGTLSYTIFTSHLFKAGANVSSGSVVPQPFAINAGGKVTTATLVAEYNQGRFKLEIFAKEKAPPYREAMALVNVWVFEEQQLIRAILSRPREEVNREKEQIIMELSNATKSLVVIDEIKYHTDDNGEDKEKTDMYLHVIDRRTLSILAIPDILKMFDSQYEFLKDHYDGFAIENLVPAYINEKQDSFEPALAALIALLIVLFVGCISVIVVCCCFKHWIVSEPMDIKQSDMLIKKTVLDDLNTTENPLWIEQKLKLYEEQELTMQVFCEPDSSQPPGRRDSADMSVVDNTYATIQHPHRRSSLNTMLSLGAGDYATLGGSVLPLDNISSHSQQMFEAALGFQGSTFQVPENVDVFRARSELRVNKDGQPEFVSELI